MKFKLLISALAFSAALAHADSYVTANYSAISSDQGSLDIDSDALIFRMGTKVHKNFSIEARWGAGTNTESIAPASYEMDYLIGGYINYLVQPDADFTPYTLLGYSKSKFVGRIHSVSSSLTEESYSYGIGLSYKIGSNGYTNIEYAKLLSTDYTDSQSLTVGVGFSF